MIVVYRRRREALRASEGPSRASGRRGVGHVGYLQAHGPIYGEVAGLQRRSLHRLRPLALLSAGGPIGRGPRPLLPLPAMRPEVRGLGGGLGARATDRAA